MSPLGHLRPLSLPTGWPAKPQMIERLQMFKEEFDQ
jgi:hypothetical protein